MAHFLSDDIDFSAYERDTECKAKVRRASDFDEELDAEFAPRDGRRRASMFSTKLRDVIEFRPGEVTCWAGFNGHRKSMCTGQVALDLCRTELIAAQQQIGALTAKLEAAQRTNVSYSGQIEGWQGRYEGLSEALSMAMDKLTAVR